MSYNISQCCQHVNVAVNVAVMRLTSYVVFRAEVITPLNALHILSSYRYACFMNVRKSSGTQQHHFITTVVAVAYMRL